LRHDESRAAIVTWRRRLDPESFEAYRNRGVPRTPDSVASFTAGRPGNSSTGDPFPHGRFYLSLSIDCPNGELYEETWVRAYYRGVIPWLAYGMGSEPGRQRVTDFVDLVDEFMDRDNEFFGCAVPWPLPDVVTAFADVVTTIWTEALIDTVVVWDIPTQQRVSRDLGVLCRAVEAHEACCDEVLVNVHWW
jgi:hypothetical protein